jgi:hypothetical protein
MMKPSPITPEYQKLVDHCTPEGAEAGKMFGMPCLKIGGKAFAGTYDKELVFKLTGDAHAEALALPNAHLFDPSDMGRPMKEWVVTPEITPQKAKKLVEAAMTYAASATKTPSPSKSKAVTKKRAGDARAKK